MNGAQSLSCGAPTRKLLGTPRQLGVKFIYGPYFQQLNQYQGVLYTMSDESSRPLDALNNARNKRVIVDCKNGNQYLGTLRAFDIHINTVLEEAEEKINGEMKRKLGTVFIRGDTIITISPA
jgi:small nuclear ribonucleoprotein